MTRRLILLVALVVSAALPSAQTRKPPEALAKELQARYQSIRDFTADFVQNYRAGVLRTQTQESGTVAVKSPAKCDGRTRNPSARSLCQTG
jgi:outer membrane lipoprotein-sorting protein